MANVETPSIPNANPNGYPLKFLVSGRTQSLQIKNIAATAKSSTSNYISPVAKIFRKTKAGIKWSILFDVSAEGKGDYSVSVEGIDIDRTGTRGPLSNSLITKAFKVSANSPTTPKPHRVQDAVGIVGNIEFYHPPSDNYPIDKANGEDYYFTPWGTSEYEIAYSYITDKPPVGTPPSHLADGVVTNWGFFGLWSADFSDLNTLTPGTDYLLTIEDVTGSTKSYTIKL